MIHHVTFERKRYRKLQQADSEVEDDEIYSFKINLKALAEKYLIRNVSDKTFSDVIPVH